MFSLRFLQHLNESRVETGHVDGLVVGIEVALDQSVRRSMRLGV